MLWSGPSRRNEIGSERPVLIYDGDCGFCRRWIVRWRSRTGDRVDYTPYQEAAARHPGIDPAEFQAAVVLVEPDGTVHRGAEAVFRTLSYAPGTDWLLRAYRQLPGAAPLAEAIYRFVAAHRPLLSRWTVRLWGSEPGPATFLITRTMFLRALGAVYFLAFASLWNQIVGLVGSGGILPAAPFLDFVRERLGSEAYFEFPTLFWLGAGDGALQFACGAGAGLGLLLVAGIAPRPVLTLLWSLYLSLTVVGRHFLHFQWDALLLETGLLAIFFAPAGLWPRRGLARSSAPAALWLLRWLLFRLMFQSGVVKIASGDPTWRDFTALEFHYETQPLPNWISWHVHQAPAWIHRASVAVMFFTELVLPFLIFAPRRVRHAGCGALVLLQAVFLVTGNYGFFNLLTIALCLTLLDDGWWRRWIPGRLLPSAAGGPPPREPAWWRALAGALALLVLTVTLAQTLLTFDRQRSVPGPILKVFQWTGPFRSINRYGLFAVMTTRRPEIQIEGSRDGRTWQAYGFPWKPGDPRLRPRYLLGHMPRLDWQMWFAALGSPRTQPWFGPFERRLLEGAPAVTALLAENPFPDAPPRYVRAVLYRYRFTDRATREAEGTWWRRERISLYTPVVSLGEETPR